jgi:hypothetical protein
MTFVNPDFDGSPFPYHRSVFLGYPFGYESVQVLHKIAITLRMLKLHLRSAYEPELGDSLPKRILRPYKQSQYTIHWLNANDNDFRCDDLKIEWLKYHLTVNPTTYSCPGFDYSAISGNLHILCHNKELNSKSWNHIIYSQDNDKELVEGLIAWFSPDLKETIPSNPLEWSSIVNQTMCSFNLCLQEELEISLSKGWESYLQHINRIIEQSRI